MGKRVVHVEFPAQDLERGRRFWEGVGGWSVNDAGMEGMQYLMWQEGDQGGAIYSMEGQSGTTMYLGSEDIDADLARVKELGGEAEDKQPIPHVGWFARCKDSEGNEFSLFQSDESVAPPQ
ncbi:MAG TPA: VOC family protein [Gaiellaceae bacterium]|nr:VOC family protein [Gaiellaceae bacterium]